MKILVIGANGLLGEKVYNYLNYKGYKVFGTYRSNYLSDIYHIDLTVPDSIKEKIETINPDALLHCAAMTDIDACEKQPVLAHKINAEATALIAELCRQKNIYMLYVSSDYVFSGNNSPYTESDIPHPIQGACWSDECKQEITKIHNDIAINHDNLSTCNTYSLSIGLEKFSSGPILSIDGDIYFSEATLHSILHFSQGSFIATRRISSPKIQGNRVLVNNGKIVEIGRHIKTQYPCFIYQSLQSPTDSTEGAFF